MNSHTITTESARRLSDLLARNKYQPPARALPPVRPVDNDVPMFAYTLTTAMGATDGTADLKTMDGYDFAGGVKVLNTLGDFTGLPVGSEGLCIRVNGVFYAIHPDLNNAGTMAATFTLTAGLAATIGAFTSATVISSNYPGLSSGAAIVVWNTGQYLAFTGATGLAVLVNGAWWIVHVDQHCTLWVATLTDDTHNWTAGDAGDFSDQRTFSYSNTGLTKLTGYPHGWLPTTPPTVQNPYNLRGLVDDRGLFGFCPQTGETILLDVYPETADAFEFVLTADRPNGRTANVAYNAHGLIGLTDRGEFPSAGDVRDLYTVIPNAKSGDKGIAVWNHELQIYIVLCGEHTATKAKATIKAGGFTGTPATFQVDNVVGLDGKAPTAGAGVALTVQNRASWEKGTAGHYIEIAFDVITGEWYAVQMRCPA